MNTEYTEDLYNYLTKYITENRKNLIDTNVNNRTKHISILLEDIYQPHNASAVLRTCDCFGIQDVHIIENDNTYTINPDVALGASKWLSLYKYNKLENNTLIAINSLKSKGYKVVATTPHKTGFNLEDFPINHKCVLMFGSEKPGLSSIALDNADYYLKIPMYGFTESFNISVSAAIIIHYLMHKLRNSNGIAWQLTDIERQAIKLQWVINSLKNAQSYIDYFTLNKDN